MTTPTVRRVAGPVLLALGLAAPGTASAARLITGSSCARYVPGLSSKGIAVGGDGFTPGGQVDLAYKGNKYAGSSTVNPAGQFVDHIPYPSSIYSGTHIKSYSVTATDRTDRTITAKVRFKVVRFDLVTPRRAKPRSVVTYKVYGFPNRKTVYEHFYFGGKRRATVRMGKAKAACGTLRKRQRYLPARVRYGTWKLYLANTRRFSKKLAAKRRYILRTSFVVYRTFHFRRAVPSAAASVARLARSAPRSPAAL